MMKQSRVIAAAASALVLAVSYVAMGAKGGKAVKNDVVWSADAIKWEDGPLKGTHVQTVG
jgi:hypothetical protein